MRPIFLFTIERRSEQPPSEIWREGVIRPGPCYPDTAGADGSSEREQTATLGGSRRQRSVATGLAHHKHDTPTTISIGLNYIVIGIQVY